MVVSSVLQYDMFSIGNCFRYVGFQHRIPDFCSSPGFLGFYRVNFLLRGQKTKSDKDDRSLTINLYKKAILEGDQVKYEKFEME